LLKKNKIFLIVLKRMKLLLYLIQLLLQPHLYLLLNLFKLLSNNLLNKVNPIREEVEEVVHLEEIEEVEEMVVLSEEVEIPLQCMMVLLVNLVILINKLKVNIILILKYVIK